MKKILIRSSKKFLILGLFITLIFSNISFGQQMNKVFEVPGGSSNNSTETVESNDNTLLYVVGGAVVVGIVVYALMRDKKENKTIDTSAIILKEEFLAQNLSINEKVANLQSQIPINISFGVQRDKAIKDERRYFVGLNYNF